MYSAVTQGRMKRPGVGHPRSRPNGSAATKVTAAVRFAFISGGEGSVTPYPRQGMSGSLDPLIKPSIGCVIW